MSYHHHSSVSSARCFNVSGDMLLIQSFSIKNLNLSLGKGLVKMSASIMSSITSQQAKLDLELVSKEKRPEIGKCNERLKPMFLKSICTNFGIQFTSMTLSTVLK
nr:hypothetical protein [Tanacetum cinerariifolium]